MKEVLGELVHNFDSRRVPLSSRERGTRPGPYPYFGATGVLDYVDDYIFEGLHILVAEDGSVERSNGSPFVQLVDGQFWVSNHAHVLQSATDEDTRYLYYALSTVSIRPYVSGSVQAKLSQANLHQIPVPYPTQKSHRRAITEVLGTLDDKIELNRRMSETLEEMARALFQSWFVDFDPVRAKVDGRWRSGESLPGLPADLHDLLPGRLVPSELGEIPEGWEVKPMGEVVKISSGKRPDHRFLSANNEAQIPLWGGNGPMGFVPAALIDFPILLTGRVGTLGEVFRITTPCWPSDNTLIVIAQSNQYFGYMFFQMKRIDFDSLNRGSTQPLLTQSDLKAHRIAVPPVNVVESFHNLAGELFRSSDTRTRESHALRAIREILLPKLVSGEVRL